MDASVHNTPISFHKVFILKNDKNILGMVYLCEGWLWWQRPGSVGKRSKIVLSQRVRIEASVKRVKG